MNGSIMSPCSSAWPRSYGFRKPITAITVLQTHATAGFLGPDQNSLNTVQIFRELTVSSLGTTSDPACDPRFDRSARVRLHAARHGQHPGLPDRSQRTDGGGLFRCEERRALCPGVESLATSASSPARHLPDPR